MPIEVLDDLPTRLRKSAERVRDAKGPYDLALEQRAELVVEAVGEGMSQLEIAKLIGVQKGRIHAILVASHSVD